MVETFNVYEAKTHLSSLMDKASAGQEIVLAKAGKKLCRLIPYKQARPKRAPGRLKGKLWIAPDAFSEKVDAEIAKSFYGPLFPRGKKRRR